jgi:CHAT domain-containing protein
LSRTSRSHLSDEEFELVAAQTVPDIPSTGDPELREHLANCEECQSRIVLRRLERLRDLPGIQPGADCPEGYVWLGVAADTLSAESRALISHASICAACGALLRDACRGLQTPFTEEESRQFAESAVSSRDWRQRMAAGMAAQTQPLIGSHASPKTRWRFPVWARYAAAAALAAVVAGGWWLHSIRTVGPDELIAQAYSERRVLEIRFPGAQYTRLRVKRGGPPPAFELSQLDRPKLLEANVEIARGLRDHPGKSVWLQARGRAELLVWHNAEAIQALRRALELEPNSPSLLVDLASAYFERGEATQQSANYGVAMDFLGQALQQTPNDTVALFNRAIVASRLRLYNQAIADLQKFLFVEPTGGWATEARDLLAQLLRDRDRGGSQGFIPRAPSEFMRLFESDAAAARASAGLRPDELLETAIVEWIPMAVGGSSESAAAKRAIAWAADILVSVCGDRWLLEISNLGFANSEALLALSHAVEAGLAGDPVAAERAAQHAAARFGVHNVAGIDRARLETVYSAQRLVDGRRCLATAMALEHDLQARQYRWAETQLLIEESICATMEGDFGRAGAAVNRAIDLARSSRYSALHLRAIGMKAALYNTSGKVAEAWSEDMRGLELYWAGKYPSQRAYQFYADLAFAAQRQNRWHLATALAREAVWAIERTPNRSTEGMAWHRWGTLARRAGLTADAAIGFQRANRIFTSLTQDDAVRRYRLDCAVNIASLDVAPGDSDASLRRLEAFRQDLPAVSDIALVQRFHQTLGMLYMRRGNTQAAEVSLREALSISEKSSRTLHTKRDREAWKSETEQTYRGIVEVLLRRGQAEDAFRLWRRYRASRHSTSAQAPPQPGETLIGYFQIGDGIAIWAVGANGLVSRLVSISPSAMERLIRRFARECADPESANAALRRDGQELYGLLIEPVAAQLRRGGRLLIEPDGALDEVPFQALPDRDGKALGVTYEVVLRVAAGDVRPRARLTPGPLRRALVVGSPLLAAELLSAFPPLPHAAQEAREAAAQFPDSTLLIGLDATLPAVLNGLSTAELFHFAGHAVDGPGSEALLLAGEHPKAWLGAKQIEALRLGRCRLAVLSACSTGFLDDRERLSRQGLASAFIHAGVPQVVATRWDVESAPAAAFVHAFYKSLLRSGSAAGALREALETTMSAPATAHPYYWAAFSLYSAD